MKSRLESGIGKREVSNGQGVYVIYIYIYIYTYVVHSWNYTRPQQISKTNEDPQTHFLDHTGG